MLDHVAAHRGLRGNLSNAGGRGGIAHARNAVPLFLVVKRLVSKLDVTVIGILACRALGDAIDNEAQLVVGAVLQLRALLVFALNLHGVGTLSNGRALKGTAKPDLRGVEGAVLAVGFRSASIGDFGKHGYVHAARANRNRPLEFQVHNARCHITGNAARNRCFDSQRFAASIHIYRFAECKGRIGIKRIGTR